ncbi:hypothetical protein ACOMHN_054649 [Nucella lapillus]
MVHPEAYREEVQWFQYVHPRPRGAPPCPITHLHTFANIIWNKPPDYVPTEYGDIPVEDLAQLCCSRSLLPGHMTWFRGRLNLGQTTSLCLVPGIDGPEYIQKLKGGNRLTQVEKLLFLMDVGKGSEGGRVGKGSEGGHVGKGDVKPDAHWVLVCVDLTNRPTVLYCDSLGLCAPSNLLETLTPFTGEFGIHRLHNAQVAYMHTPTKSRSLLHQCSSSCRNFPQQGSVTVSGVVGVVCAAVAALDPSLFGQLTGPRCDQVSLFLKDPARYQAYLRRVLIYWLMRRSVDKSYLSLLPAYGMSGDNSSRPSTKHVYPRDEVWSDNTISDGRLQPYPSSG